MHLAERIVHNVAAAAGGLGCLADASAARLEFSETCATVEDISSMAVDTWIV
jgi:hypothetical protein